MSKYVRDGKGEREREGGERVMLLNCFRDLFTGRKGEDEADFQSELRGFAYRRGMQFDVSCRGSIVIFCMTV